MTEPRCIFCRIVGGEIPADIVAQTPEFLAFRDISPQAPVHVVIIPRAHLASLNDVTAVETVGGMALLAKQVAQSEGIADRGYRTVINTNADGGQSVYHLHMHVLGNRAMGWPPG